MRSLKIVLYFAEKITLHLSHFMKNEINQTGTGNQAFQDIQGPVNVTNNYGRSPEYIDMLDQLKLLEDHLKLIPDTDSKQRSKISAKIFALRERIESFKSDILELSESFSRMEINTDRLRRAKEHFDKGEITEARIVLEDALEEMEDEKRGLLAKKREYKEETLPKLQAKADEYLILAQTTALNYGNPNRVEDAMRYFKDSLECEATYENLFSYARFLYDHSHFAESVRYWNKALKLAQKDEHRFKEAKCLGKLGLAHDLLGQFKKAITYIEKALAISRKIGDRHLEGRQLGSLGMINISLGKSLEAISYQESALAIAREIADRRGEGYTLGNLGLAYDSLGEFKKAVSYHRRALYISRQTADRRSEEYDLGNLGIAYYSMGKYKKSIDYHQQALTISREIGDKRGEGLYLMNLGLNYEALGYTEKASNFWQQALAILEENHLSEAKLVREWMKVSNHDE